MLKALRNCLNDEAGQGMTEYVLVIALVALGTIAAFVIFREALFRRVQEAADSLEQAGQ